MKRLAALDRVLISTLVPVWLVCWLLVLRAVVLPLGFSPLNVVYSDGYPTVVGPLAHVAPLPAGASRLEELLYGFQPWEVEDVPDIRSGDRIVAVGDVGLQGKGSIAYFAHLTAQSGPDLRVPVTIERSSDRFEIDLPLYSWRVLWILLPISAAWTIVAVIVVIRVSDAQRARSVFVTSMLVAICSASAFGGGPATTTGGVVVMALSMGMVAPMGARLGWTIPDPQVSPIWLVRWSWVFAILGPLLPCATWGILLPHKIAYPMTLIVMVLWFLVGGLASVRSYRAATPVGRRRAKWFSYGVLCSSGLLAIAFGISVVEPIFSRVSRLAMLGELAVPFSLLFAMARYNLFDIDRLISATAAYNVVVAALIGTGLVGVPPAASALSTWVGIDPAFGRVGISLFLASLVVPMQRRLRPQLERLFFTHRYGFDTGVDQLLRDVSVEKSSDSITRHLGARLVELIDPEACVIYGRGERGFSPIFAFGPAVPPALEGGGPLVEHARHASRPFLLGKHGGRSTSIPLNDFERAAMASLGAELIVPIRRGEEVTQILCLGPKRSGDVYTPVDLSGLARVADRVSAQLARFDDAEVLHEAREMQAALRRYVPGAIAQELASGHEVISERREVSVLFVDIRGYTAYAEGRRVEEIFSTVNAYTELVSKVIRDHGGAVVEFNGDGMMAVFGAPQSLPAKEQAAVLAAREVIRAVEGLGDAEPIAVGIGIATGDAYVGNVQAADRLIWTALGNTTNLAARLQALTRELDAEIIIDSETAEAASGAARGFEPRTGLRIRGRSEPMDVHVLSLPRGS